jgi:hypothetical protein
VDYEVILLIHDSGRITCPYVPTNRLNKETFEKIICLKSWGVFEDEEEKAVREAINVTEALRQILGTTDLHLYIVK